MIMDSDGIKVLTSLTVNRSSGGISSLKKCCKMRSQRFSNRKNTFYPLNQHKYLHHAAELSERWKVYREFVFQWVNNPTTYIWKEILSDEKVNQISSIYIVFSLSYLSGIRDMMVLCLRRQYSNKEIWPNHSLRGIYNYL